MPCSGTCWLLGGTWFWCGYGDFGMSFSLLMFPGIRSCLMFSSFGFKPPGFQSCSYSQPQDFSIHTAQMIKHVG